MTILVSFGTRPEYIKVKSIIDNFDDVKVVMIRQHTDILDKIKDIKYDYIIDVYSVTRNRMNNIINSVLDRSDIFNSIEYVLVQGDTTSALSMALSAFNHNKKIIHLEAGLRSGDIHNPFPEEGNRQLISRLASINLCPTKNNYNNLISERVSGESFIVGNTGLDNINTENNRYGNSVLITLHRRDNHCVMDKWFREIRKLSLEYQDLNFIFPMHPSPNVRKHAWIFDDSRVKVTEPISHKETIDIIKDSRFVISDSGGLQEECAFLNKKIIICRKTTERQEMLENHGVLCKSYNNLYDIVKNIYYNYEIDKNINCPFGDGQSWKKIKKIIYK